MHAAFIAKETGCQSGVRSCIMPGLSTHLVQELNIGTVVTKITESGNRVCQIHKRVELCGSILCAAEI